MHKFAVGSTYFTSYIGDSNIKVSFRVISRTDKTVQIETGKRCKIMTDSYGNEFIYPEGKYSMCLVLRAEYEAIRKSLKQFGIEYNVEPNEIAITDFLIKISRSFQPYKNLIIRFSDDAIIYRDFC